MRSPISVVVATASLRTRSSRTVRRIAGIESRALTQLRKLAIPTGDEATVKPIYDKVDQLLATTSDLAAAYRAGNVPKAKDLQTQALALQKAANDAATAYGMTSCGA